MRSPVERLEEWCDEQERRPATRVGGQATYSDTGTELAHSFRAIIAKYRVSKDHAAWLTTQQVEDRHKAEAYREVIEKLAAAVNPEETPDA